MFASTAALISVSTDLYSVISCIVPSKVLNPKAPPLELREPIENVVSVLKPAWAHLRLLQLAAAVKV